MSGILDVSAQEAKIAERVNPDITRALAVSRSAGGVMFADAQQITEFAKMMAVTGVGIRKHLRGNVGACLAIAIQAVEWEMSPFAVANQSYFVNDQIAFQSMLVQAVILKRAPIKGRIKFGYEGEGDKRICIATAVLADSTGEVEYRSPPFLKIQPKNSPLWKTDPDQQHSYYSGRALCRRHFPDVLLGVYTEDELYSNGRPAIDEPTFAKDVTPALPRGRMNERLDAMSQAPAHEAASLNVGQDIADLETGEVIQDGDEAAAADEEDADGDGAGLPVSKREQVIHRLRGELMQGASALRILNDLPADEAALLTQEDRDDLKASWKQMQGNGGKSRRAETVDG